MTMYDLSLSRSQALVCYLQQYMSTHSLSADASVISFYDFMQTTLYHPQFGYYNAEMFELGAGGDFTTAAEISPLYAYCFAKPCRDVFEQTGHAAILELGAGSGRFAANLLHALKEDDALPDQYYIYDISPTLRRKQQAFLKTHAAEYFDRIKWLTELPQNFSGIVIANEVLDALPVHCFVIEDHVIYERGITYHADAFHWHCIEPSHPALATAVQYLKETYQLPEHYISEINLELKSFLTTLTQSLKQGVLLFADYGYGQSEYYHPHRQEGTLTCYHQHKRGGDPFSAIGMQDITAHVDFTHVAETMLTLNCTLLGYTSQAAFLLACDLPHIAAKHSQTLTPSEEIAMNQGIKILTLPHEMGERCKIMAFGKETDITLTGFHLHDKRCEL